jgi:signal transduction histidine kinase
MRRMANPQLGEAKTDVLHELKEEYASTIALLDRTAAIRRVVANVPALAGVDLAWVGQPEGAEQIVLGTPVNALTDVVDGLVVPVGAGLGGRVLAARRPLWVSDYCVAPEITHHFDAQVQLEGIRAMIAVPIVHDGHMMGVLYGASRQAMPFGDRTSAALEELAAQTAVAQVVVERARHAAEVAVHEERRRLAMELHDTVGAMLFTLRAGIRQLGDEPQLDEAVRARLRAIEGQAADASAALRGSLHVLHAPPAQVALGSGLREHCRAFTGRTGVEARVLTLTELPSLPHSAIQALTNAAREALHNVEKHARARSVVISVFALRSGVAVTVSDDGVGLAGNQIENRGGLAGLGLLSMSERLARLGGSLNIGPNDDGGVTVQAWIPA